MKQIFALLLCLVAKVAAHGWMTNPVSKNELAYHHYQYWMPGDFRYEPQTCNIGNGIGQMIMTGGATCGAKNASSSAGLHLWNQWYKKASVPVPRLVPGSDIVFNFTLTIDHGGQGWMMVACAENIEEKNDWVILPRAQSDRTAHFMPSAPGAFAWAPNEMGNKHNNKFSMVYHIPEDFSCSTGHGVGRWVWKTGNSCNDANNIARKTERFDMKELEKVYHAYQPGWVDQACTSPPETFISCMDFLIGDTPPSPTPSPGPPQPAPAPPPPADCGAAYAQCAGQAWSGPTCCQGTCSCQGTSSYKQCKPAQGQWKC